MSTAVADLTAINTTTFLDAVCERGVRQQGEGDKV